MNLEEEVFRIGKQLEKIVNQDAAMVPEEAVDLLTKLKDLPITLECLQKTRIGMSVNTLRKKSDNGNVQTLAKSLIKLWKKLLPEKSGPEKKPENGKAGSEKSSRSTSPALSTKSDASEPATPKDNKPVCFPNAISNDTIRGKCRDMITNSLKVEGEFEAVIQPQEVAAACEQLIFEEFRDTNVKYKQRIRSRVNNLRDPKNPLLKVRVLGGEISPTRLATMTSEDMASEDMKKLRQEYTKEGIRDAQMAKNSGTKTNLFKCGKCGLRETTYTQPMEMDAFSDWVCCYAVKMAAGTGSFKR